MCYSNISMGELEWTKGTNLNVPVTDEKRHQQGVYAIIFFLI